MAKQKIVVVHTPPEVHVVGVIYVQAEPPSAALAEIERWEASGHEVADPRQRAAVVRLAGREASPGGRWGVGPQAIAEIGESWARGEH